MNLKKIAVLLALGASVCAATAAPMHLTLDIVGKTQIIGTGGAGEADPFSLHWSVQYDTEDVVRDSSPYGEHVRDGKAISVIETSLPLLGLPSNLTQAPSFAHGWGGQDLLIFGPWFGEYRDEQVWFTITPGDGVLPVNILTTPGTLAYSSADGLSGAIDRWNPDGSSSDHINLYPTSVRITVSAVPEPATYGMVLAGLALVGVAAARRKTA